MMIILGEQVKAGNGFPSSWRKLTEHVFHFKSPQVLQLKTTEKAPSFALKLFSSTQISLISTPRAKSWPCELNGKTATGAGRWGVFSNGPWETFWSLCTTSSLKCTYLKQHLKAIHLFMGLKSFSCFCPISPLNYTFVNNHLHYSLQTTLMAILESSTRTLQDDTAHLWHTFVIQSSLFIKADFPCKKLLYGLFSFTLWFREKPIWCRFKHHHIFTSLLRWDIAIITVYLPVRLSMDPSHITPEAAVQYFPYSILQQEATQVLQDSKTPETARTSPLVKSSLKIKAFLQWTQRWRILNGP